MRVRIHGGRFFYIYIFTRVCIIHVVVGKNISDFWHSGLQLYIIPNCLTSLLKLTLTNLLLDYISGEVSFLTHLETTF